jgi:hypothetical protein
MFKNVRMHSTSEADSAQDVVRLTMTRKQAFVLAVLVQEGASQLEEETNVQKYVDDPLTKGEFADVRDYLVTIENIYTDLTEYEITLRMEETGNS